MLWSYGIAVTNNKKMTQEIQPAIKGLQWAYLSAL